MPASASPSVSANIPKLPEILRVLASILIRPPPFSLVESWVIVALILASSPMSTVLASISIFPGAPFPVVSVVKLVPSSRFRVWLSTLIVPAFPLP